MTMRQEIDSALHAARRCKMTEKGFTKRIVEIIRDHAEEIMQVQGARRILETLILQEKR